VRTNRLIEEIYETGMVRDTSGKEYALSSTIDPAEGEFLFQLIRSDGSIAKTLEVGCAFGLSSLYICEALRDRPEAFHIVIDPKQMDVWHGVGIANLERAGIEYFRVIHEPSELALPDLLRNQPGCFDLIFIDGWHTFDQTMLDMFYANRLTRVGGYVVIDDCNWQSVAAAVSYYMNYPAYELLGDPAMAARTWRTRMAKAGTTVLPPRIAYQILPTGIYSRVYRRMRYPSMVAFKKVAEDARGWTWFKGF
jgi:predicted O-methyltransferase YrrM